MGSLRNRVCCSSNGIPRNTSAATAGSTFWSIAIARSQLPRESVARSLSTVGGFINSLYRGPVLMLRGADPWSAADAPVGLLGACVRLICWIDSGTRASRADQGVRPTTLGQLVLHTGCLLHQGLPPLANVFFPNSKCSRMEGIHTGPRAWL